MNSCKTWIVRLVALLVAGSAPMALAQDKPLCGDDIKQEVALTLAANKADGPKPSGDALAVHKAIYEKYQYCKADAQLASIPSKTQPNAAYCARVPFAGSTFYESMPCCGYDPQKREFACPIEIRKPYGFGPAPFPGSREFVLTCVDFGAGAGFVEVARDSVHLADSLWSPNWFFAVTARAEGLAQEPLKGQPLKARSILSWAVYPMNCYDTPVWGNALDYTIRLDP